jgi:hypothetical protein
MILLLLSIVTVSTSAMYCKLSSITCAILFNKLLRSVEDVFPKFEMLQALSTASSKSSLVECAACVNTFPSTGE